MPDAVGTRIRALRLERGWSLEELGRRANLALHTVWQVEVGRVQPKLSTLEQLATALDTTVGALTDKPAAEEVAS